MLNAVKSVLADVSSVSPSSEQRLCLVTSANTLFTVFCISTSTLHLITLYMLPNTLTYSEEKCEMAAVPFGWEECLQFLLKCIIFSLPLVLETGLVTPLGIGVENVWQKLISGMCGITRIINEGVIYNDVFIVSKYMNQFLLHNKTDCFSFFE